MANSRLHGPTGNTCLVIDNQTLARTQMHSSGSIGTDDGLSKAELERQKREIALDLAQLILDLTGIVEPTPVSDGTNTLISIARGNWFDAAISAISIVPYIGDLSKVAKLPRYLDSIRKAIRIARVDAAWRPVLKDLFKKIKTILDRLLEEAGDKLPSSALKTLKAIKKEIDDFLGANVSAMGKADSPASAPASASGRQSGGGAPKGGSPQPKGKPPKDNNKTDRSDDKSLSRLDKRDIRRLTRDDIKKYLGEVKNKTHDQISQDLEKLGLEIRGQSPDGKFKEFVDKHGNIRAKLHPPDKVTKYPHLHIYDKAGKSLDSNLSKVPARAVEAHIRTGGY